MIQWAIILNKFSARVLKLCYLKIMNKVLLTLTILSALLLSSCTNPKDVPKYLKALQSSNSHDRSEGAMALGRIGSPHADNAVPQLIRLLDDTNAGVQSAAAYALRKIDTPDARVALDKKRRFQ